MNDAVDILYIMEICYIGTTLFDRNRKYVCQCLLHIFRLTGHYSYMLGLIKPLQGFKLYALKEIPDH